MNSKDRKDRPAGSDVEKWLPIKPPPALLGNSEKLRQRVNELLDQYRADLQEHGPERLRDKRKSLQRYRDDLARTLEGTSPIKPEESDPEALPYGMSFRKWQELERSERVRIYKKQWNTKLEIEFRLDVLANALHRHDRYNDITTKWGGPSREDTTDKPIPLKDAEVLGPEFVKACKKARLIAKDTDPESAANRLFITGEGAKIKWTGHKTALIRLFDLLYKKDLLDKVFWDERNAALKRHFLYHDGNGKYKPVTRLKQERSRIAGEEIQQAEAVQEVVSQLANHLSA